MEVRGRKQKKKGLITNASNLLKKFSNIFNSYFNVILFEMRFYKKG